ncbi:hypothetical protein [Paenibacillus thiaminolyticus]|uniref:hypothetical protein n=1 Tax=Paenibacillus thiaminolyticus TaxID=49283 RepID=UPI0015FF5848|nr:hypothetical protein [Paenibacillus thiaminolyticus]
MLRLPSDMKYTLIDALNKYIDILYYDSIPKAPTETIRRYYEVQLRRAQESKKLIEEQE